MDVQTGFVYIGVVVFSALVIVFVSLFGTKGKSYEEAIAEQRKLSDDLLLSKKDKNKEKKHKSKAGKKVKEKKEEKDDKDDKDEKAEHVQFEETPQILSSEPPVLESNKGNKKKGKLEKIKSILVNKDEPLVIVPELSPLQSSLAEANHFDLIHPKDDLELVRSHSRENLQQLSQAETTVNKSPKDTPTKSKKSNKDAVKKKDENAKDEKQDVNNHAPTSTMATKENMKEVKEQQKDIPVKDVKEPMKEVVPSAQLSNKESKKTKKKNDILAQIGGDKDAVNVSLLTLFIEKAELSRSEIQILIDQLLNKQLDNPLEHSEWTEGRADPVIKLKKQLAEKEKALTDEHEASIAFQNKLKELRTEFNSDRSRQSATIKQLEETLNAKIMETQTLHTRMQHILESHAAEKQGFTRQIEQLQTKLNEDSAIIHKMQEDQGQTQGHLQQELIAQRKQMEVQFAQMRENENALKAQLAQKHVEMQELQNDLQATCESSTGEIDMLRQQIGLMQGQLIHSEGQLQHFKETGDTRLQDAARQLEESHRAQTDLDHRLKSALRHEQELQKQVNSMQAELNIAKTEANEAPALKADLNKAQSELMKLKSELSASLNEAKSEAAEITALKVALSNKEDELKKSQNELNIMQDDLQQSNTQVTHLESELNITQTKYDVVTAECEITEHSLQEAKNNANKYQKEAQEIQKSLTGVQSELAKAHAQLKESIETASELKVLKTEISRLQNNEKNIEETHIHITKLQEENDRLRAELVNSQEKQKEFQQPREKIDSVTNAVSTTSGKSKAAEEHENDVEDKSQKINLHLAEQVDLSTEGRDQLETLKAQLKHKEEEFDRINARIHVLESDVNKQHNLTKQLQNDLEVQKSKNNELRTKNWKVMEAFSAAESRAKSSGGKNIEEATQKLKAEQEEVTKAFLQRIFPEIKVSEKTHDQWLKTFEHKVRATLNELKQKHIAQPDPDLEKKNKNLQDMVSHYKQIIDDTEGMLNNLQNHVESEETRWEAQFRQKENEVTNLRIELKDTHAQLNTHEKEKHRLSQELQTEWNKRTTLDAEITKLRSLVETSEASLSQEKNLVTQLQQEVSQLKNETCGGGSSSEQSMLNGPPTADTLQSEPPLATQTPLAAFQSTLLKNTEFANCSKPDNLVQSEQENENSPLTTNNSSKSCHTTDNNTQTSWKPFNGQQHKKHKKKRKGGSGKK